jgi:hypothetical protein
MHCARIPDYTPRSSPENVRIPPVRIPPVSRQSIASEDTARAPVTQAHAFSGVPRLPSRPSWFLPRTIDFLSSAYAAEAVESSLVDPAELFPIGSGGSTDAAGSFFRGRPRRLFTGAPVSESVSGGTLEPGDGPGSGPLSSRFWTRANSSIEAMAVSRHCSSVLNSAMIFAKSMFTPISGEYYRFVTENSTFRYECSTQIFAN